MSKLQLSLACGDSDKAEPLLLGQVQPEGIELTVIPLDISEMFHRMLVYKEFDISEMSTCSYLLAKSTGIDFTAIPVFPIRSFRHSFIYCNSESKINEPRDLIGRKVGIHLWQNTAAVWVKGYLQNDYDVDLRKIRWVAEHEESFRIPWKAPEGLSLTAAGAGRNLFELLEEGKIDAFISPNVSRAIFRGSKKVKRLFPDYFEVEKDYYKRTGIYPMMHVEVIKDSILEKTPWVATSMMKAFTQAKEICNEAPIQWSGRYSFVWNYKWMEVERDVFQGKDPFPYGLVENEKALKTLIHYCHQQGLVQREVEPRSLFFPSTVDGT